MRHFIIVKWQEGVDREQVAKPVRELFSKALEIEGVDKVDVHVCNSDRSNRYDMMIEMFMSKEGLEAYDSSEMHKQWKREYGDRIAAKTIFDCDN